MKTGFLAAFLCGSIIAGSCQARTWYVKADGTGEAATIQAGIDSCVTGDTILVAAGTYTGNGNRDCVVEGKGIAIVAENTIGETVIDCDADNYDWHWAINFDNTGNNECVLDGITIMKSYPSAVRCDSSTVRFLNDRFTLGSSQIPAPDYGGGLILYYLKSTITMDGCILFNNSSSLIHVDRSEAVIRDCEMHNNFCNGRFCLSIYGDCRVLLERSSIHDNGGGISATPGPGIESKSYLKVKDCSLFNNSGDVRTTLSFSCADSLIILNTEIVNNITRDLSSGCVKISNSPNVYIENSKIAQNGGIALVMGFSSATILNTTILNNNGLMASIYLHESEMILHHVTFAGNSKLFLDGSESHITAENCLIAFNKGDWICGGGSAELRCCDVYGNQNGDWVGPAAGQDVMPGNFSADPLFCSIEDHAYTIHEQSPCAPGNHPSGCDCGLIGALGIGCNYVATLLRSYDARCEDDAIALTWEMTRLAPDATFEISRQWRPSGTFETVSRPDVVGDGATFTYYDRDCEPGTEYRYRVVLDSGDGRSLLFETDMIRTPAMPLTLRQNYPNPFNPSTTLDYYLPVGCTVSIGVYDAAGALISRLAGGECRPRGRHSVVWDGSDELGRPVASGVYFCRLSAGGTTLSRKMVLIR